MKMATRQTGLCYTFKEKWGYSNGNNGAEKKRNEERVPGVDTASADKDYERCL